MMLEKWYIIGFIDGEGTINLTKYPNNRLRPQLLVFNTNKEILESIKETLNLSAPILRVSRVNDKIRSRKECFRLQVRSKEDIIKIIKLFEEHNPIVKKEEYKKFKKCFEEWMGS